MGAADGRGAQFSERVRASGRPNDSLSDAQLLRRTLETYCTRGWCRLEMLAALSPKRFPTGLWRQGSVNMRFRWHHNPADAGAGPLLCAEHILNPITGRFTVMDDLEAVAPLVVALANRSNSVQRSTVQTCLKPRTLANRYQEYENEGATIWDRTVDVRKRPECACAADGSHFRS